MKVGVIVAQSPSPNGKGQTPPRETCEICRCVFKNNFDWMYGNDGIVVHKDPGDCAGNLEAQREMREDR